jgi:hypothetical protein
MPVLARPTYQDPFAPVLFSSPALEVSAEQLAIIREVLSISSSDEQFADKAFRAIVRILTAGNTPIPVLTSLSPSTVVLGSPTFDIHVMGTGFNTGSKIIFNGFEEPTTFVSETELTTGVNMDVWAAPAIVPVLVQNADGTQSTPTNFEFTAAAGTFAAQSQSQKTHVKPIEQGKVVHTTHEQKVEKK